MAMATAWGTTAGRASGSSQDAASREAAVAAAQARVAVARSGRPLAVANANATGGGVGGW
jgi:hypothetical protein